MFSKAQFLALAAFATTAFAGPIVNLGYASYEGVSDPTTGFDNYFDIRYAAAPTGNLRFKAPQPPPVISGVQDASEWDGLKCPQGIVKVPGMTLETVLAGSNMTEDCLKLDVVAPTGATSSSKLPVVVHIHGGGYGMGNKHDMFPHLWANLVDRNVVNVAINYRLGLFGFLAGKKIKQKGDLNAGILDQQFALRWVKSHISKFGGNPNDVTIWGESAGGGSVMLHAIANGGHTTPKLFNKGIALSPYIPPQYDYDDTIPEANYAGVVTEAGCSSASDTLACLRGKPLSDLIAANVAVALTGAFGTFTWQPVTDGSLIRTLPSRALIRGFPVNGDKIIATHNAADGALFAEPSIATEEDIKTFLGELYPKASPILIDAILALYPPGDYASVTDRAVNIIQDPEFACAGYWLAQAYGPGKAWKGTWAVPPALHGFEMPYIYGTPAGIASQTTYENFVGELSNFILTGNPNSVRRNSATNPEWKSFNSVVFGAWEKSFTTDAAFVSNPSTDNTDVSQIVRCLAWQGIGGFIGI